MESQELRIFREVARAGSISKAAGQLGYVQSNVTARIKKLEEELNAVLLIRHSKGVTLTAEGERLLIASEDILDRIDRAAAQIRDRKTFRIGAAHTLSISRLPLWLTAFQEQLPEMNLSVVTDSQDHLAQYLSEGKADCAFLEAQYVTEEMETLASFQETLCIIAPFGCAEREMIQMPAIVNKIAACPYRARLLAWFQSHGVPAPRIIEMDTVEATLRSVELGMGISLLPASVLSERQNIAVSGELKMDPVRIFLSVCKGSSGRASEILREIIINGAKS